ncbi:MAG: DUF1059 domain-containing protein [Ignavibacteriae bacterium]|nr:MAG: DUF1059 domain-containing protein [Ignavibacteriota bacterium]
MDEQKTFTCSNFSGQTASCLFTATDEEPRVIEIAVDHVMAEHGFMDTPELRQQITDSLTGG